MAYAIMRSKKLSGMGSVAAALKHCFRERETPNADPSRTPTNDHLAASSTDQAMGKLRDLLPEKRRKDAVLAVEYVLTASPEWWKSATADQQADFFRRSRAFLEAKYGPDRIVVATIHRDEASPHLSAFVVPLTKDRRLSAKDFIGGRDKMRADQTKFAESVRDLGLDRGIEGSRATHQRVKSYYAAIAAEPVLPTVQVPPPSVGERLNAAAYGQRVAQSAMEQVGPEWRRMADQATEATQERRRRQEAERTAREARTTAEGLQKRLRALEQILSPVLVLAKEAPQTARNLLDRLEEAAKKALAQVRQRAAGEHVQGASRQQTDGQGKDR